MLAGSRWATAREARRRTPSVHYMISDVPNGTYTITPSKQVFYSIRHPGLCGLNADVQQCGFFSPRFRVRFQAPYPAAASMYRRHGERRNAKRDDRHQRSLCYFRCSNGTYTNSPSKSGYYSIRHQGLWLCRMLPSTREFCSRYFRVDSVLYPAQH